MPVWGKQLIQDLLKEGHEIIPSKWVDTDKNAHLIGSKDYVPKNKARLLICGNFENVSRDGVRCDSPTLVQPRSGENPVG